MSKVREVLASGYSAFKDSSNTLRSTAIWYEAPMPTFSRSRLPSDTRSFVATTTIATTTQTQKAKAIHHDLLQHPLLRYKYLIMKEAQVLLRWFFGPVLLFLVACRTRIRLANCLTMLTWSIEVGHGAEGPLRSGCVNEMISMKSGSKKKEKKEDSGDSTWFIDVSDITTTPAELEAMYLEDRRQHKHRPGIGNSSIPRILHQSYISTNIHSAIYPFVQSWHEGLSKYPDWKFVWWSDEDIRWLVHTHYPTYAKVWEGLPHSIMKADTARYFILHRYGGFYADMDIEYLHANQNHAPQFTPHSSSKGETMSLEDWFRQYGKDPVTQEEYNAYVFHECVDNSMMASIPNSDFWPVVFKEWTAKATNPFYQTVNRISGIDMLKDICDSRETVLAPAGVRLSTPDNKMFAYHHGTNTWRWKTKRDDIVRICDVIIMVHMSIFCAILTLSHWLKIDVVRWILCRGKKLIRLV